MIIIDFNAIAMATIFGQAKYGKFDERTIKHFILNQIRIHNKKFREEYGRIYIACDAIHGWRKKYFKEYKASRSTTRSNDDLNWDEIYSWLNSLKEDLKEHFPYPVIEVDTAEADDIIACLVESTQEFGNNEKVMIISGDKDFIQLQKYKNVKQYSPIQHKFVTDNDPHKFIFEHVLKGDSCDGVPNVLSDDDTFITEGKRQKPLRKKQIDEWEKALRDGLPPKDVFPPEVYRNFKRNERMINLSAIPQDVVDKINEEIAKVEPPSNNKIFNYLIKGRYGQLVNSPQDFYVKDK